jgi:hypothetical protein
MEGFRIAQQILGWFSSNELDKPVLRRLSVVGFHLPVPLCSKWGTMATARGAEASTCGLLDASINCMTSASLNKTTRSLILIGVRRPAVAHLKIVFEQTPNRSATIRARKYRVAIVCAP